MHKPTTGMKMVIPAIMNYKSDLSLKILMRRIGGHPIGEVFLIINPTVRAAVNIIMCLSNLFEVLRK